MVNKITFNALNIRQHLKAFNLMIRNPRFWATQIVTVGIAVTHDLLERYGFLSSDLADFLPVSLFWIPLIYVALRFGSMGSITTAVVVLLANISNWLYMQRSTTITSEILLVVIAIAISLIVGRQVDQTTKAQRQAQTYADSTARRVEDERRRLSLALHDDPIQTLISVCHEIDTIKVQNSLENNELFAVRKTITKVIENLRDVSVGLHPPILDDIGITSAVRDLLRESGERMGFEFEFSVSGEELPLRGDIRLSLFRIAQEALRNIERHANAKHVQVGISFTNLEVRLDVIDDGVGFDLNKLRNDDNIGSHLGLSSISERIDMCGGKLELWSKPAKGTRITVKIPSHNG
jgi:signal transduction histidine kinase